MSNSYPAVKPMDPGQHRPVTVSQGKADTQAHTISGRGKKLRHLVKA